MRFVTAAVPRRILLGLVSAAFLLSLTSSAMGHPAGQTGQLLVFPIKAEADPPLTFYSVEFANPQGEELRYSWTGPDCGDVFQSEGTTRETNGVIEFGWSHPHPPCDDTLDHSHVTITLTVTTGAQTIVCTYQGALAGEGGPCRLEETSDPRDSEGDDTPGSAVEEFCQATIGGAFQPSQGVWQDDPSFADKPTKQLTRVSESEWIAELPMVSQRRTLLFGTRSENHQTIVITGEGYGSTDVPVAVRFSSDATSPSTIHTTPVQYTVPIGAPCTDTPRQFTIQISTAGGLPEAPAEPFQFPSAGPYVIRAEVVTDGGGPTGVPPVLVHGMVVDIPALRVTFRGAYLGVLGTPRSHVVATSRFVERAAARLRSEIDAGLPIVFPLKSEGGLVTTSGPALDLTPIINPEPGWLDKLVNAIGLGRTLTPFEQQDLRLSRINDFFTTEWALANPGGSSGRYIAVLGRDDLYAVWGGDGINGFSNRKGGMVATDVSFRTVAHEIAHTTGRPTDSMGWLFSTDEMLRDCGVDYHNQYLRVANGFRIGSGNDRTRYANNYHMMVAVDPPWWISQCTYWHLVHRLQTPLDPPVIQVRGVLSRIADAPGGMLLPAFRMDGVVELPEGGTGQAAIVLRDASGNVLARYAFEPTWQLSTHNDDGTVEVRDLLITSFGYQVPDLPGTARIDLEGPGGVLLHSLTLSPNAPTVRIEAPAESERVRPEDDVVTVRWSGSDPDGDDVTYTVLYSPDGGDTWLMQVLDTEANEWPVVIDPEGEAHLVKVIANDGLNTSEDVVSFRLDRGGLGLWIIIVAVLGAAAVATGIVFVMRLRRA